MKWIEIKIKTDPEAVEAVTSVFYDVGIIGVVIEDPRDIMDYKGEENDWDYIDPGLIVSDDTKIIIKGYLAEGADLVDNINFIKSGIQNLSNYVEQASDIEVSISDVDEEDWANNWKKYYKPTKVGQRIVIKPTWETYESQEEEQIIELDPGMAFGTGTHETTAMCIGLLEEFVTGEQRAADIGCGSGVLAIAAGKLGAKEVDAVDLDSNAVRVAKENVKLNNMESLIKVHHGNLSEGLRGEYDIIVANIIADIIIILSSQIQQFSHNDSIFIASGIIHDRVDEVLEALRQNNFEIIKVEKQGEWNAIAAKVHKGGKENK
jgi:ribosomal protein L11 methyltransferase